jgi:hypothetical protein
MAPARHPALSPTVPVTPDAAARALTCENAIADAPLIRATICYGGVRRCDESPAIFGQSQRGFNQRTKGLNEMAFPERLAEGYQSFRNDRLPVEIACFQKLADRSQKS